MSHVRTVVFSLAKDCQDSFTGQINRDVMSLRQWPGNISAQAWISRESTDTLEIVLLSKWNYRTDFEAWLITSGYQEIPAGGRLNWQGQTITTQINRYKIIEDQERNMEETTMTHVQTAVFTVDADYQAQFQEKIKRDVASLKAWEGNISAEGWQGKEADGKIDFILVSKWSDIADFDAWLNRPEHMQNHKTAEAKDVRQHVTRQVASYDVLTD